MSEGLFTTTGHALATAFLIISTPPQQDCALRRALIQILEAVDLPTRMQRDWLAQLKRRTTGFAGLTDDETRAQCAMIVNAVRVHLPGPEQEAVIGAYTRDPIEKAAAVRYLSNYLKPDDESSRKRLLFDYCVLRSMSKYGNKHLKSERFLTSYGVTDRSAAAYLREIRKRVNALRKIGEGRLEAVFMQSEVVNAH